MSIQEDYIEKIKETIIQFDSCTALLNAQARFLHSQHFYDVGLSEKKMPDWVGPAINLFPKKLRQVFYTWGGWADAIPSKQLNELKAEDISRWVVSLFPKRKYSGMMFGSANGAAIHLASALKIPWIPQTYLVAVKRDMHPDEIIGDIQWGQETIRPFLAANPQMKTVQMHDPLQDRLMIQKMGYFRIKRLLLGEIFKSFIKENLAEGAPLITIECRYPWPQFKAGERHYFQLGGFGALNPEEYWDGSSRVREFLKKMGSPVIKWKTYKPSGHYPEGEWGFEEESLHDIREFARKEKIPLRRMVFDHPEGLSEFCADLYRWWYKRQRRPVHRMIIENFGLIAPFETLQTSSVPFWLAFNTEPSYERIRTYLQGNSRFQEIFLMLMSNGVAEGVGLTTIEKWKEVLQTAKLRGDFVGVNEREYPLDFGTFFKYDDELLKKIKQRYPLPVPLDVNELKAFIDETKGEYPFQWIEEK